jgi:hypothetical protein
MAPRRERWRDWREPIAIGGAALAGALVLFRPPAAPAPSALHASRTTVHLTRQNLAGDEAALFDPTPLFLPTDKNSTEKRAQIPVPGGVFPPYRPELTFDSSRLALGLDSPIKVPGQPIEAVHEPSARAGLGFGRKDVAIAPLPARRACVEAFSAGTGERVAEFDVSDAEPPPSGEIWRHPPEYLAAIDASGLVEPLILMVRSGNDDIDTYFRGYLQETLRIGLRLPPGFYRITVGP